jgi:hypothetical protein
VPFLAPARCFFGINLLVLLAIYSDTLIISNPLASAAVAEYAVVQRLSLVAYFFQALVLTLWPRVQ